MVAKRGKDLDEALLVETVRSRARAYLRWPNITSVGVGYRMTDGKPTDGALKVGELLVEKRAKAVEFRFVAEFFREPDAHLGILQLGMSMGQWLCIPMIVGGIAMWVWASKQAKTA